MRPPARGRERFSRDPGNDRPLILHENTDIEQCYEVSDAKSNFAGASEQQMPAPAGLILSGVAENFSLRRKTKTSEAVPPPANQRCR